MKRQFMIEVELITLSIRPCGLPLATEAVAFALVGRGEPQVAVSFGTVLMDPQGWAWQTLSFTVYLELRGAAEHVRRRQLND